MAKYYPPQGFLQDPKSGMFYRCHTAPKADGTQGNYIVWFNTETGQYTQPQEYAVPAAQPVVAAQPQRPIQQPTQPVPQQPVQQQPVPQQPVQQPTPQPLQSAQAAVPKRKKSSPLLPIFLVLALLVAGGYYLYQDGTLQEYLPFLAQETSTATSSSQDADATTKTEDSSDTTGAMEDLPEPTTATTPEPTAEPEATELPEATAEPETTDALATSPTTYTGTALTNYLGTSTGALQEVITALWNQFAYSTGSVTTDFSEGIDTPYAVQEANCKFLKASALDGNITYEGIIWASNHYNVTNYLANPYWFRYTIQTDGTVTLEVSGYSTPNAYLTASYTVANEGSTSYISNNVVDGNASTAWSCDGRLDESITYTLNGTYEIYGFAILNGYWKSDALYNANGKAGYIATFVNENYTGGTNLYATGYNSALANAAGYDQIYLLDQASTGTEVSLMVTSLINGSKYDDICISELLLLARPVA